MRAGLTQGGIISPVLFRLHVNEMPLSSSHVELALYANDTAVVANVPSASAARQIPGDICDSERWLCEWRMTINVSKSSAMLFAQTGRRIPKPRSVQLFGEPNQWVDDTRYLGVNLDKQFTWSKHRSGKKESDTEAGGAGTSSEQHKTGRKLGKPHGNISKV
jgi:hypothetical protein